MEDTAYGDLEPNGTTLDILLYDQDQMAAEPTQRLIQVWM